MSLPRRLAPQQTHLLTRRTQNRRALLRPSALVNQIILYALGRALELCPGVKLHAFATEVTHQHTHATDAPGGSQLSNCMREFHSLSARALNAHYGRGENVWSQPGSYVRVRPTASGISWSDSLAW